MTRMISILSQHCSGILPEKSTSHMNQVLSTPGSTDISNEYSYNLQAGNQIFF